MTDVISHHTQYTCPRLNTHTEAVLMFTIKEEENNTVREGRRNEAGAAKIHNRNVNKVVPHKIRCSRFTDTE